MTLSGIQSSSHFLIIEMMMLIPPFYYYYYSTISVFIRQEGAVHFPQLLVFYVSDQQNITVTRLDEMEINRHLLLL